MANGPSAESYKPVLDEIERIAAAAGLEEEDMRKSAAAGTGPGGMGGVGEGSRNRR
jgi:hypothetical protein